MVGAGLDVVDTEGDAGLEVPPLAGVAQGDRARAVAGVEDDQLVGLLGHHATFPVVGDQHDALSLVDLVEERRERHLELLGQRAAAVVDHEGQDEVAHVAAADGALGEQLVAVELECPLGSTRGERRVGLRVREDPVEYTVDLRPHLGLAAGQLDPEQGSHVGVEELDVAPQITLAHVEVQVGLVLPVGAGGGREARHDEHHDAQRHGDAPGRGTR